MQVYQRQLSKEGLQSVVNSAATGTSGASSNAMSTEELRDLFTLRRHTRSDTYGSRMYTRHRCRLGRI